MDKVLKTPCLIACHPLATNRNYICIPELYMYSSCKLFIHFKQIFLAYYLHTTTKTPFMYSFSGNCAASVPISTHIHVSVSDLCIARTGPHIFCSRTGISIVWIYKSLTDTWICKLGLWPRNSFSGNICFEFSLLVLCSAEELHSGYAGCRTP